MIQCFINVKMCVWILYIIFMVKGELFIFMRKNYMGFGKYF